MFPVRGATPMQTLRLADAPRAGRFRPAVSLASFLLVNALLVPASRGAQHGDDSALERVVQKTSKFALGTLKRSPVDLPAPGDPNNAGKAAPSPEPARPDDKNDNEHITPMTAPTIYSVIQRVGARLLLER